MQTNLTHQENLFLKYSDGTATKAEVRALFALLAEGTADQQVLQLMANEMELAQPEKTFDEARWARVYQTLKSKIAAEPVSPSRQIRLQQPLRYVAAAVFALMIFGAGWFYIKQNSGLQAGLTKGHYASDLNPGQNGATLTLENGKVIPLNAGKAGFIVGSGQLSYTDGAALTAEAVDGQLIASTAQRQTYQVTLADGSKVWLNAQSSLRFPSKFLGKKQRIVELNGEAYFEISKDKKHPFIVKSGRQELEVLGTHFNVNSYGNEPDIKTTLLEGKVKINHRYMLEPGYQLVDNESEIVVNKVDPSLAVAWTTGSFSFQNAPLEVIMRQVSRWYGAQVSYASEDLKQRHFTGSISRYDKVSSLLKTIELSGVVTFQLQGNKITVNK